MNQASLGYGIKLEPAPYKVQPRPGILHWKARFTEQQIRDIRASTLSQSQIIKKFGGTQGQISRIRSGKAWRSVK